MRLSHVKYHHGTVVEEEQTALDALRDSCGLSCQEMGGGASRTQQDFTQVVTEATRSTSISTSLILIVRVHFSKWQQRQVCLRIIQEQIGIEITNQNGGFQDAWIDQRHGSVKVLNNRYG